MASSRFSSSVPLSSIVSENGGDGGGGSNGSVSSSSALVDTENDENSVLGVGYRLPPAEIRDIVDAPPLPILSFSPYRDKLLFLKRRSLPPISELAKPEEKLAGIRIDGQCNCRSRMSFYTGIGIHQLMPDDSLGPEKEVHGLPDGAKINFVTWSPNGRHLSFSVRVDEEDGSSGKLRVWVADVETGKARPLFQNTDIYVNAVFENFVWVNDSTLLVCTIPSSRGDPPKKPLVPHGPKVQSNEQKNIIQARTFQDLLKDKYDEDLFDYYATIQLVLGSLDGTVMEFGTPAIYTSLDPSPDHKYILISTIHRPYSFTVPCSRFPKKVAVWTTDGKFVRELCHLPLAEDIPIAFNSVRKGMRSISWRADKPSTLYWVETQDGGDARIEVSPRDIGYTQSAEPVEGEQPEILHKLDLRYGGIYWCDDSLALVYESWYKTRRVRTWVISPGSKEYNPRILFDRSSEDVYSDPGSPMLRRTPLGTYVIAKLKKENYEGTYVLLNGSGATPEGNIPFIDLFDINTGSKERIWKSDKETYYECVVALMSDKKEGDLNLDELKFFISKESKTENTQYYILRWPDKKASQITKFPHPYPQLKSLQKEMIRYERKDGVQLTATLYLPPNYDPAKDGPLPCLIWSYPGEFKSKDAAGQVRGSPNEFASIGSTSALLWLARRFAILAGPTIPIIGEGNGLAHEGMDGIAVFDYNDIVDMGQKCRKVMLDSHDAKQHYTYEAISLDDIATLVYTSGTTGNPKGVMLTHRNLLHQIKNLWDVVPAKVGDKFLSMLPPWHAYERACEYFIFTFGVEQAYTTIRNLKDDLRQYQPDYLISVPLVYETLYSGIQKQISASSNARKLLVLAFIKVSLVYMKLKRIYEGTYLTRSEAQPSHIVSALDWLFARTAAAILRPIHMLAKKIVYSKVQSAIGIWKAGISGGGSLPSHVDLFFEAIGITVQNGYGLTECSPVIAARRPTCNVLGSVGHPIRHTEFRIVDMETGDVLPPGSRGIVEVKGPQVMKGYYKNSSATQQVLDKEGWFSTGDIGWIAPHHSIGRSRRCGGVIVLDGRAKDTIVLSTGENVEPTVLEEAAMRSSLIQQIVVIGQDQRRLGAIIVPNEEEVLSAARKLSVADSSTADFSNETLKNLIYSEVRKWTSECPFQIGPILIVNEPFTIDNGLMTPTMKVRRDKVAGYYKKEIENLFK